MKTKLPALAVLLPMTLTALGACQAHTKTVVSAARPEVSSKKPENEERDLQRKLAVAELKLAQAKLDQESQQKSSAKAVEFAMEELAMAEGKKAQFENLDRPNREARGELDLQRAEDRTTEAAEELKQLEIMYREQDLEDMTAEFVINRGKRSAERAAASLAVQRRELEALTQHTMPRELRNMVLSIARKSSALEKAKADAESARIKHEIAVMNAKTSLSDLKEKLEKMTEGDSK